MLGIDDKLNEGLQINGMSVEHFAALAAHYNVLKASKAKLYESFRGGKALDHDTALTLWQLWLKVLDLIERARPFELGFKNPENTKFLLDLLDLRLDISAGVIRNQTNSSSPESR